MTTTDCIPNSDPSVRHSNIANCTGGVTITSCGIEPGRLQLAVRYPGENWIELAFNHEQAFSLLRMLAYALEQFTDGTHERG